MHMFKLHANFLIVAPRFSGKSTSMKYLLYHFTSKKEFHWGVVISSTARCNKEWNIIPDKYIFDTYKSEQIEKIYNKQSKYWEKDNKVNMCIVFDDCLGNAKFEDPIITKMFTTGRHTGITVFLVSQYLKKIPPTIRQNADCVFFQE